MTNAQISQLFFYLLNLFQCVEFMKIYYESLINLLEKNEELSKICEQVGMCFRNEAGVTLGDNGKFVYLIKKMYCFQRH